MPRALVFFDWKYSFSMDELDRESLELFHR